MPDHSLNPSDERDDVAPAAAKRIASAEWTAAFGGETPKLPPAVVKRALAWRAQVQEHGDISLPVRRDLQIVANQIAASRVRNGAAQPTSTAPREKTAVDDALDAPRQSHAPRSKTPVPPPASSQLTPGARLVKHYGGRNHVVEVTAGGFLYEGVTYASLSAIAKHITGTHWNGLLFFGLRKRGVYPKKQHG